MKTPPIETLVLIIGAVAILFWPSFSAMVKSAMATFRENRADRRDARAELASGPKTRADWVTDLMELHDLLVAAGETELAKLCCELCNGLICIVPDESQPVPAATKSGGGKRER